MRSMGPEGREKCRRPPPMFRLIRVLKGRDPSLVSCKILVFILTFIAYTCYHASRKPTSVVKSVLDPQSNDNLSIVLSADHRRQNRYPWPVYLIFENPPNNSSTDQHLFTTNEGWAPFNGKYGTIRLGEIDVAFLSVYSFGMYFTGHVADQVDLRVFLTVGMIGSGLFVALYGMGYWWNIHNFFFYLVVQMIAGLFQSTGWPSVVAVFGNWFGKQKRGLIMGIWNAHTSVGNICGSLLASSVLPYGWGWSFILPGALIAFGGVLVFLFLVVNPEDVGFCSSWKTTGEANHRANDGEEAGLPTGEIAVAIEADVEGSEECKVKEQVNETASTQSLAVGFIEAWMIPGVAPFAFCLLFSKLVAYTFLDWLPYYISHTDIGGEYYSAKSAGDLSTLFDVGGIVGGIIAGHISDRLDGRAITAAAFMYCAIPALILYRAYGSISIYVNMALMMIAGMFVNGPYALITTAVSADLGTHGSLKGNSRALATVTAIIDGTGSVGAALGPLLTGFISTRGWNAVFIMLVIAALIAALLLTRLVVAEIAAKIARTNAVPSETLGDHGATGGVSQPLLRETH